MLRVLSVRQLLLCCALMLSPFMVSAMSSSGNTSGYTQTRHPIMLVQGILAFDNIAGIDYWYKIGTKLQQGGAKVYVAHINAFNNSIDRGEQLIHEMETLQAMNPGIEKFNLIAHSQGGLTARYVMSVRPDLVASVTTVGSPHQGAPIADLLNGVFADDTLLGNLFEVVGNTAGNLIDLLSGDDVPAGDVRSLTTEFTSAGAAAFNQNFPAGLPQTHCGEGPQQVNINGNNIRLYSWGGDANLTNILDPLDYLFATTGLLFGREGNDGITGRCSNHFGKVLRDNYPLNHADLINQVLGLRGLTATDPLSIYRSHANRLKNAGL